MHFEFTFDNNEVNLSNATDENIELYIISAQVLYCCNQ